MPAPSGSRLPPPTESSSSIRPSRSRSVRRLRRWQRRTPARQMIGTVAAVVMLVVVVAVVVVVLALG